MTFELERQPVKISACASTSSSSSSFSTWYPSVAAATRMIQDQQRHSFMSRQSADDVSEGRDSAMQDGKSSLPHMFGRSQAQDPHACGVRAFSSSCPSFAASTRKIKDRQRDSFVSRKTDDDREGRDCVRQVGNGSLAHMFGLSKSQDPLERGVRAGGGDGEMRERGASDEGRSSWEEDDETLQWHRYFQRCESFD